MNSAVKFLISSVFLFCGLAFAEGWPPDQIPRCNNPHYKYDKYGNPWQHLAFTDGDNIKFVHECINTPGIDYVWYYQEAHNEHHYVTGPLVQFATGISAILPIPPKSAQLYYVVQKTFKDGREYDVEVRDQFIYFEKSVTVLDKPGACGVDWPMVFDASATTKPNLPDGPLEHSVRFNWKITEPSGNVVEQISGREIFTYTPVSEGPLTVEVTSLAVNMFPGNTVVANYNCVPANIPQVEIFPKRKTVVSREESVTLEARVSSDDPALTFQWYGYDDRSQNQASLLGAGRTVTFKLNQFVESDTPNDYLIQLRATNAQGFVGKANATVSLATGKIQEFDIAQTVVFPPAGDPLDIEVYKGKDFSANLKIVDSNGAPLVDKPFRVKITLGSKNFVFPVSPDGPLLRTNSNGFLLIRIPKAEIADLQAGVSYLIKAEVREPNDALVGDRERELKFLPPSSVRYTVYPGESGLAGVVEENRSIYREFATELFPASQFQIDNGGDLYSKYVSKIPRVNRHGLLHLTQALDDPSGACRGDGVMAVVGDDFFDEEDESVTSTSKMLRTSFLRHREFRNGAIFGVAVGELNNIRFSPGGQVVGFYSRISEVPTIWGSDPKYVSLNDVFGPGSLVSPFEDGQYWVRPSAYRDLARSMVRSSVAVQSLDSMPRITLTGNVSTNARMAFYPYLTKKSIRCLSDTSGVTGRLRTTLLDGKGNEIYASRNSGLDDVVGKSAKFAMDSLPVALDVPNIPGGVKVRATFDDQEIYSGSPHIEVLRSEINLLPDGAFKNASTISTVRQELLDILNQAAVAASENKFELVSEKLNQDLRLRLISSLNDLPEEDRFGPTLAGTVDSLDEAVTQYTLAKNQNETIDLFEMSAVVDTATKKAKLVAKAKALPQNPTHRLRILSMVDGFNNAVPLSESGQFEYETESLVGGPHTWMIFGYLEPRLQVDQLNLASDKFAREVNQIDATLKSEADPKRVEKLLKKRAKLVLDQATLLSQISKLRQPVAAPSIFNFFVE